MAVVTVARRRTSARRVAIRVLRRVSHDFHFPLVVLRVLFLFSSLLVDFVVSQSLVRSRERLGAVLALVRLLTGVDSDVRADVVRAREMSVAMRAWERLFFSVHARVSLQFVRAVEGFGAVLPSARVLFLFRLLLRCLSDLWASRGRSSFGFDWDRFEFEVLVDGARRG